MSGGLWRGDEGVGRRWRRSGSWCLATPGGNVRAKQGSSPGWERQGVSQTTPYSWDPGGKARWWAPPGGIWEKGDLLWRSGCGRRGRRGTRAEGGRKLVVGCCGERDPRNRVPGLGMQWLGTGAMEEGAGGDERDRGSRRW